MRPVPAGKLVRDSCLARIATTLLIVLMLQRESLVGYVRATEPTGRDMDHFGGPCLPCKAHSQVALWPRTQWTFLPHHALPHVYMGPALAEPMTNSIECHRQCAVYARPVQRREASRYLLLLTGCRPEDGDAHHVAHDGIDPCAIGIRIQWPRTNRTARMQRTPRPARSTLGAAVSTRVATEPRPPIDNAFVPPITITH